MSVFSENLLTLRKGHNYSAEIVAVKCNISYSSYRRYETGEREPTLPVLCAFADLYGITLDQLAGRDPLPFGEDE